MTDSPQQPRLDIRRYRNSFLGMGVLVCATFLIFGSWPLYGALGAFGQFAVWIVLFATACRWFTSRPVGVLLLGVASVLVWVGVVLVNRL